MIWTMFTAGFVLLLIVGSICGLISLIQMNGLRQELSRLKAMLSSQGTTLPGTGTTLPGSATATGSGTAYAAKSSATVALQGLAVAAERIAGGDSDTADHPPHGEATEAIAAAAPVGRPGTTTQHLEPNHPKAAASARAVQAAESFEMQFGARWIIWIGAIIFLCGIGLGLKYAFDNNLIGPTGRLMVGILIGGIAIVVGEYLRKKQWRLPFQVLTGTGFAIFYLCVYFSFSIYHKTGAETSMAIAVLITLLATALAVFHNALPIALLAVMGGFMSPLLLSSGENRPWGLFSYLAILNLVALGTAWFRRWPSLERFCLVGTALIYLLWYNRYYTSDQMTVALLFAGLFFLQFTLIPALYALLRGIGESFQTMPSLVVNTLFWLTLFFFMLFDTHRTGLGFVIIAQAATLFGLYVLWIRRSGRGSRTSHAMLIMTLALITLVIPVQLKLYTVPIAWAIEGVAFLWLGVRFGNRWCRVGGVVSLALAAFGLFSNLPLHTERFLPLFNAHFGAWVMVILLLLIAARIVWYRTEMRGVAGTLTAVALILVGFLMTLEVTLYWDLSHGEMWQRNRMVSLLLLWTLLPAGASLLISRVNLRQTDNPSVSAAFSLLENWRKRWNIRLGGVGRRLLPPGPEQESIDALRAAESQVDHPKAQFYVVAVTQLVGTAIFFSFLSHYRYEPNPFLALNLFFLPATLFVANLVLCAYLLRRCLHLKLPASGAVIIEIASHWAAAALISYELIRYGSLPGGVSIDLVRGIVSAAWAVEACLLIWLGLKTNTRFRRYSGFALFALATVKLILVDTLTLAPVFRIVSWLGIGLMLLVSALLYHRYSSRPLLAQERGERQP